MLSKGGSDKFTVSSISGHVFNILIFSCWLKRDISFVISKYYEQDVANMLYAKRKKKKRRILVLINISQYLKLNSSPL